MSPIGRAYALWKASACRALADAADADGRTSSAAWFRELAGLWEKRAVGT